MALTLLDMAAGMKDEVMQGIVLQYARSSLLFQLITFKDTPSFTQKGWENSSYTDAVWREIGAAYSETKDKFVEKFDGIYLMGGQIDIDRALRLPGQTELDAWAENLKLQSKRFSSGFLKEFIDGDRGINPERFNGIKQRVEAVGGDQVIAGGSLDLAASSANRQTFLDQLEQSIFEVEDGEPDVIVTSKQGLWSLNRVARREGLYDTTKDAFDRKIDTYRGIPVIHAGVLGDQTTAIITATETAAGARVGGTDTSSYFVKFSHPNVQGIQMHEPKRIYDDIISDGVTHRTVFEWPVGLTMFQNKSVVRYRGVKPL